MDWSQPHSPSHECPRCWDLFGDWADDTDDIATTDHRTGYDSLVLKPEHPSRTRWLVRARRAAMDRYAAVDRGQAIVEMALVLPLMLTLLLGIAEVGILGYTIQRYQDAAEVLAAHSAELDDDAWTSAAIALASDVGCDLAPSGATRTLGAMAVTVRLECQYHPVAYAALDVPVTVEALAP